MYVIKSVTVAGFVHSLFSWPARYLHGICFIQASFAVNPDRHWSVNPPIRTVGRPPQKIRYELTNELRQMGVLRNQSPQNPRGELTIGKCALSWLKHPCYELELVFNASQMLGLISSMMRGVLGIFWQICSTAGLPRRLGRRLRHRLGHCYLWESLWRKNTIYFRWWVSISPALPSRS